MSSLDPSSVELAGLDPANFLGAMPEQGSGDPDGHHLINRTDRDAVILEVGNADPMHDTCTYSDIDMIGRPAEPGYRHRNGDPYPVKPES